MRAAAGPSPARIASSTSWWWRSDSRISALLLRARVTLSEISDSTTPRTTLLQTWTIALRLARATASWKATSASLNSSKPASIACSITTMVSSIAASSGPERSRAASMLAEPSRIIRNDTRSAIESWSTRVSRVICLASPWGENGRISGPCGSPGRERTIPLLSSTRSASRTVERLAPNWVTSSRSLGNRSPGRSDPVAIASSICSTMRW